MLEMPNTEVQFCTTVPRASRIPSGSPTELTSATLGARPGCAEVGGDPPPGLLLLLRLGPAPPALAGSEEGASPHTRHARAPPLLNASRAYLGASARGACAARVGHSGLDHGARMIVREGSVVRCHALV